MADNPSRPTARDPRDSSAGFAGAIGAGGGFGGGRRGPLRRIDGGVKTEHARKLAAHGASMLVAGSAVFEAKDPAAVIKEMRAAGG